MSQERKDSEEQGYRGNVLDAFLLMAFAERPLY